MEEEKTDSGDAPANGTVSGDEDEPHGLLS